MLSIATAYLPHILMAAALSGAIFSLFRPIQIRLPSYIGFALVTLAILFLLVFGVWSGSGDPVDHNYFAIAGRVPQSDAGAYFMGSFEVGYSGRWGGIPSIRPLAAAFRDLITGVAGLSYVRSIVIQALALSAATFFAARCVHRWLGPWAALAFTGFILNLIRPFLGTAATENFGLIWGALAVAFLADTLRTNALSSGLSAIVCLSAALVTRSGAVFLLPAMMLWAAVNFSDRKNWKPVTGAIIVAGVGPFALASLLGMLYGAQGITPSWNFSLLLCGLATGTSWAGCQPMAVALGIDLIDIPTHSNVIYEIAWQAFKENPGILLNGIWSATVDYFYYAPTLLLNGYSQALHIPFVWGKIVVCIALPGLIFHLWRARSSERMFWVLAAIGFASSVGIVFATDGWRTLYATHPLIVLFLVIGLHSGEQSKAPSLNGRAAAAFFGIDAISLIAAPFALHVFMDHPPTAYYSGRAVTGFVVVPDGAPTPAVPYLTATEFARTIAAAKLESDWGEFVTPTIEAAPVAVFWTAQIGLGRQNTTVYIGPADILSRPNVAAWRFKFKEPDWEKPNAPLGVVESAEPAIE